MVALKVLLWLGLKRLKNNEINLAVNKGLYHYTFYQYAKSKTIFIEYYEYNIAFFAELLPTFPILAHCVNDISVTRVSNGNYLTSDIIFHK